eukprot:scaffold279897_cov116-Cyclotella_meneghiniana.AAC.1
MKFTSTILALALPPSVSADDFKYRFKLESGGVSQASTDNAIDFYLVPNVQWGTTSDVFRMTYEDGIQYCGSDDTWRSDSFWGKDLSSDNFFENAESNLEESSVVICNRSGDNGLFIDAFTVQYNPGWWWNDVVKFDRVGGNGYCFPDDSEFSPKCPMGQNSKCSRFNLADEKMTYGVEDDFANENIVFSTEYFFCLDGASSNGEFSSCSYPQEGIHGVDHCEKTAIINEWIKDYKVEEVTHDTTELSIKCKDRSYELGLYVLSKTHFFIGGSAIDADEVEATDIDCPFTIAFASIDGTKKIFGGKEAMNGLAKHPLGQFTLGDILIAEKKATAINDSEYDLTKNTCIHYAGDIWRSLGVKETQDMADFLVSNLVG